MIVGDLTEDGLQSDWDQFIASLAVGSGNQIASRAGVRTRCIAIPGNHDTQPGNPDWHNRYTAALPFQAGWGTDAATGTYYTLQIGSVLLIGLDAEHFDGSQNAWLEAAMDAANTDPTVSWIVPCVHQTMYPCVNVSGSPLAPYQATSTWARLFEGAGVPLVLSGHQHRYQRTVPMVGGVSYPGGVVYVTVAPAGGAAHPANTAIEHNGAGDTDAYNCADILDNQGDGVSNFGIVTASKGRMMWQAYKRDGGSNSLIDTWALPA